MVINKAISVLFCFEHFPYGYHRHPICSLASVYVLKTVLECLHRFALSDSMRSRFVPRNCRFNSIREEFCTSRFDPAWKAQMPDSIRFDVGLAPDSIQFDMCLCLPAAAPIRFDSRQGGRFDSIGSNAPNEQPPRSSRQESELYASVALLLEARVWWMSGWFGSPFLTL